jgi:hypothetical protein
MSLVSVAEIKARIKTVMGDADLQTVIDQAEADVVAHYGAHYVDGTTTATETVGGGLASLYLRRPLASVTSIVDDGTTLTSDDYRLWASQGRVERLPRGTLWGDVAVIVYKPANDNTQRKRVIIDLVRLDLERTAMTHESVGGEYSYNAPDWEQERAGVLRRLKMGL